jgi:flagellar assembly protein FliH
MSSRLIRPDAGVEALPIVWRATGVSITQTRESKPTQVPEAQTAEIQQAIEARVKAAYQQGHAAGEASAQQRAQQKIDPVLQSLNGMIAELTAARKRVRAEAEDDAVKLSIAIARRVLYRELATDPEAILGLVKAAFGKLDARETHRLRVSASDAASIQKLQIPPGLEIVSDRSLTTGSAIFETSRGDLDASIETQLAEIDRGLTDTLKRRK